MDSNTSDYDQPEAVDKLSAEEQSRLIDWIKETFCTAKRPAQADSYGLKHVFERTEGGFYLTNGQFKGAMLRAGFLPIEKREQNWRFRLSRKACSGRLETKGSPYGFTPCYHPPDILTGLCSYHRDRKLSRLRDDSNRPETREEWLEKIDAQRGL